MAGALQRNRPARRSSCGGVALVIAGPLRHPGPALAIRKARPQDDTILRRVDAAPWTADVSPGPAPPVGTAFFSERTRPEDVLVAEVEGVVVGYTKLSQSIALPSHDHVLTLNGLAVDPQRHRRGAVAGSSRRPYRRQRAAAHRSYASASWVPTPAPGCCTKPAASSSRASFERSSSLTAPTSTASSWLASSPLSSSRIPQADPATGRPR